MPLERGAGCLGCALPRLRLRFKIDGNGQTTEYQYGANRRLLRLLFSDGTSYQYAYDARGNRTLEKSPAHERGLVYDALGRVATVEDRTLGRTVGYVPSPSTGRGASSKTPSSRRTWLERVYEEKRVQWVTCSPRTGRQT